MWSDPITFACGVTAKNRLVKSAMTDGLADVDSRVSKAHHNLYAAWSDMGAGILMVGNIQVLLTRMHNGVYF